ncbi:MAG: integrase [Lachnospiraceae bacterium]|nr:integrase [Lachnospiraceae bacterium]
MGHTPYGYRIENGKAVIDEVAATQVRELYKNYLSGLSLTNAAKEAGLDLLHSGAKRMMRNMHYLGDDFYPAIIDKASFDAVEVELNKRSTKLGRNDRYNAPKEKRPPIAFRLGDITENYDNPIRQAEYLYSLIESEVI